MLDLAIEENGAARRSRGRARHGHRGRLNVLNHVVGIGPRDILREFGHVKAKDGALQSRGPAT
jgi:hypothetical protein